jgi:hypothetical protein
VKDAEGNLVQGRTRWRRFAALLVPSAIATGAIVFGLANGAIAASFAVSGQTFKVSADRLEGSGFEQWGGIAAEKGCDPATNPLNPKCHPVAVSAIASADLTNLCQSVKVPGLPVTLVIRAGGGGNPAHADGLLIDMDGLAGNATFENIKIGRDASDLDPHAQPGSFGQNADSVVITDLKQIARSTSAGSFTLPGMKLNVKIGGSHECFPDSDVVIQ